MGCARNKNEQTVKANPFQPFQKPTGIIKQLCHYEVGSGVYLLFQYVEICFVIHLVIWMAFGVS